MRKKALLSLAAASCAVSAFGAPATANAFYSETFWQKPNILGYCEYGTYPLGGGLQTSTADGGGLGRRTTRIEVNGGFWEWGAIYPSGAKTQESYSQIGSGWEREHVNTGYGAYALSPFAKNDNASSIGLQACWKDA
jgi:hypothetical protein